MSTHIASKRAGATLALCAGLLAAGGTCFGRAYPAKPIRLVLPVGPGSGVETSARIVNAKLQEGLGQPVVIDFHAGAMGQIGAEIVARAAPDGYTLLYTVNAPIASLPAMVKTLPYDPIADFTPITAMIKSDTLLAAGPSLQARDFREMLEYARRNPGKVTYGTNGVAGSYHLLGAQTAKLARVELLHVPYKSGGPSMIAAQSGEIDTVVSASGTAVPFIKSGKLRPIVIFDTERSARMPDVPAIIELLPGFEPLSSWVGFLGPAKLPRDIVNRWRNEVLRAVSDADIRAKLEATGQSVVAGTPEELAASIRKQLATVRMLVTEAGIAPQ
jgi:tripartite-type tricarboxylate transporter receptor subunit TctC